MNVLMWVYLCVSGDMLSEPRVYEDLLDVKALKKFMETQLEDYNMTPGVVPMSLVLFRDAIEHSASQPHKQLYRKYTVHKFP